MQIIHFKKFCVPVSTGTSKVDKLLKMPPDPLALCFAHYECNMPASLYIIEASMMALIA